jgi:trans-2,3-dihydro-3-hydroxyanthranilate isomerase
MRIQPVQLWTADPAVSGKLIRQFLIADTFTGSPLEGSQLAIFPDGRGLSDELMLKAAREMNYSETAFFLPPEVPGADARVRVFTPGGELPFAGQTTLGSGWVLAAMLGQQAVTLQIGGDLVPVQLQRDGDAITFGWVSQPAPSWGDHDRSSVFLALGTTGKTSGLPVEWYQNGPVTVYVEVKDEEALDAILPDAPKLARLPVYVTCFTQTPGGWSIRTFASSGGLREDPASGSAAGPLAVHLARHGRVKWGEEIEIRQVTRLGRPSVLYARAEGTADAVDRILVGGRVVPAARGEYQLS